MRVGSPVGPVRRSGTRTTRSRTVGILLWSVQLAFRRGGSGCGVIGTRLFPLSAGAARMSACEHGSTGLQFLGGIFAQASSSFGPRRTGGSRLRYDPGRRRRRSEEHTSELQSLMRISYAVFCLKKKNKV